MKSALFYIAIGLIAAGSIYSIANQRMHDGSNGKKPQDEAATASSTASKALSLKLEFADTPTKREKGLSNRPSLDPEAGMLFIFDRPDYYQFWMKDMKFPLDLIWLDANNRIVHITSDFRPESYPKATTSSEKASRVLEVISGYAQKNGLKKGDTIIFSPTAN